MAVLFIYICRMPFVGPTPESAYPLFALGITSGFYLHHGQIETWPLKITHKLFLG